MQIATIVGARPQFIKAAAVSRLIRNMSDIEEILVHTGQHYDRNMSEVFFRDLEIPSPDHHLGIGSGSHGIQTGRMLESIETVLMENSPDLVLVYGDTNSTLAGALAAVKLHIPVAHVEAGLRSFNRRMPEEINRILTDHASDLLFAPTRTAEENLSREGIPRGKIHLVGDVMYDASLFYGAIAEERSRILDDLGLEPRKYVLATVHRAENTDDPNRLKVIIEGLKQVAESLPVVLPIHPRTRDFLGRYGLLEEASFSLRIIDPLGYLDMIKVEKNACAIATDSGGVQKEAFFYRVPCVTLREETEWVELLHLGWNRLANLDSAGSLAASILDNLDVCPSSTDMPYGDGRSAEKILHVLKGVARK